MIRIRGGTIDAPIELINKLKHWFGSLKFIPRAYDGLPVHQQVYSRARVM